MYKESEKLELKSSFGEWKEIIISLGAFVITFLKNEGLNKLIDCIQNNPGMRLNQISWKLSYAPKTIERWLKVLKNKQKIEYRGSKKTGAYFILS